jgi:hypothetical protein
MNIKSLLSPALLAVALALPPAACLQAEGVPSKSPEFLKVDGVYIFDANESDLIKVLEIPGNSAWVRVQTRVGESWVNIDNITTITPVSKEAADQTEMKTKADFIRDGAMVINAAIDDYATKRNLSADAPLKWEDIRKSLKQNSVLYNSGGKDVAGRLYIIGPKVEDRVKVNADTIKEFSPVIDDPDAYWGKFKP